MYERKTDGRWEGFMPWDFSYDESNGQLICPYGKSLRHTTSNKDGKCIYRSTRKVCRNCPCREQCGANTNGQKVLYRHIWQEALDLAEQIRKTAVAKDMYAMRKQTIGRVFADAKEKLALWHSRYTHSFSFLLFFSPFYFRRRIQARA